MRAQCAGYGAGAGDRDERSGTKTDADRTTGKSRLAALGAPGWRGQTRPEAPAARGREAGSVTPQAHHKARVVRVAGRGAGLAGPPTEAPEAGRRPHRERVAPSAGRPRPHPGSLLLPFLPLPAFLRPHFLSLSLLPRLPQPPTSVPSPLSEAKRVRVFPGGLPIKFFFFSLLDSLPRLKYREIRRRGDDGGGV